MWGWAVIGQGFFRGSANCDAQLDSERCNDVVCAGASYTGSNDAAWGRRVEGRGFAHPPTVAPHGTVI